MKVRVGDLVRYWDTILGYSRMGLVLSQGKDAGYWRFLKLDNGTYDEIHENYTRLEVISENRQFS